tara:strand:- start:40 stop:294 length:255 start_codon:yes stop_codon:yes gene_type:complete
MKNNLQDLITLDDRLKNRVIAEEEFNSEKGKLLNNPNSEGSGNLFGLNENLYSFYIHITVLSAFSKLKKISISTYIQPVYSPII